MARRVVVTGAFSYIGAAVALELLARGFQVHSLTNRRAPQGSVVSASPLRFNPEYLSRELVGADAFVNTYWVRLLYGGQTFVADLVERNDDVEVDAAGPEVMTFMEYVKLIAKACRLRRLIIPTSAWVALAGLRLIQSLLCDIVLTREEWLGLQQELLVSHQPPLGSRSVGNWLVEHGEQLGRRYVNDVNRHFGTGVRDPVLTVTADRLEQWKR